MVVLPEAAGACGAGREIHVALSDFPGSGRPGLLLEEVDQVARREACLTALADVGDLPTSEEILLRGYGKARGPVAAAPKRR